MSRTNYKGAAIAFGLTLLLGALLMQTNLVGHVAFALEKAVLDDIDQQLPTHEELAQLARVNRLVARKSLPAVVHIMTKSAPTEEFRRAHGDRPTLGQGSGVIIDAEKGIILTNNHVVGDAFEIVVKLSDGRKFDAELVGHDPPTDLAVIRIEADRLFELSLGDSDSLEVGDPVMTIGNPFGLEGSVSKGIVSAKDRSGVRIIDYEGFIQTDAVINPGNSGGPLVNMRAEIVGINTAIQTTNGTFSGVGLSIPSSRIKRVLPALLQGEQVVRGYLGINMRSVENRPEAARKLGWMETRGIIVSGVVPYSPAAEAGFRAADILVNMEGEPVTETSSLSDRIAYTAPGSEVVVDVWRDNHLVSLQVVVGRQPGGFSTRGFRRSPRPTRQPSPEIDYVDAPELGLALRTINKRLARRFHLQGVTDYGVVITEVDPKSNAGANNIRAGDVIVAVNGNSVTNLADLRDHLIGADLTHGIDLRVRNREGTRHVLVFPDM